MRLGGLFSGIGGFELAWERLGHEVAWVCEIDKSAQRVLRERFPNAVIYDDVTQLDPDEVEPVDVLTGGSPCQGFSVAGQRTGLLHGESRLFGDYVRIIDGLAPRGLRYAVWENVPGVFSITDDEGEPTYEHVVAALVGADEPVRLERSARWNAGMAARRGRAVAWRVLDSRYFGVAQRRRRVFAVVALGDTPEDRAGRALLAIAEGVPGHHPSRDPAWEGTPAGAQGRALGEGVAGPSGTGGRGRGRADLQSGGLVPPVAGTLGAKGSGGIDDLDRMTFIPDRPDVTGPLTTGVGHARGSETTDSHHVFLDEPVGAHETGMGWWKAADHAGTLRAGFGHQDSTASNLVVEPEEGPWWDGGEIADTLTATSDAQRMPDKQRLQAVIDAPDDALAFRKAARAQSTEDAESWVDDGIANTLTPFDQGDIRTTHAVVQPAYGLWGHSGTEGAMEETSPAVTASHGQPGNVAHPIDDDVESLTPWPEMPQSMRVYGASGASPSLMPHGHQVMQELDEGEETVDLGRTSDRIRINAETSATLQAGGGGSGAKTGLYLDEIPDEGVAYDGYNGTLEIGVHRTLRIGRDSSDFVADRASIRYGVRRLTPVECERLQGFPDGWTEAAGADSARYKALGNAVTVNTVHWILGRIHEIEEGRP